MGGSPPADTGTRGGAGHGRGTTASWQRMRHAGERLHRGSATGPRWMEGTAGAWASLPSHRDMAPGARPGGHGGRGTWGDRRVWHAGRRTMGEGDLRAGARALWRGDWCAWGMGGPATDVKRACVRLELRRPGRRHGGPCASGPPDAGTGISSPWWRHRCGTEPRWCEALPAKAQLSASDERGYPWREGVPCSPDRGSTGSGSHWAGGPGAGPCWLATASSRGGTGVGVGPPRVSRETLASSGLRSRR